VVERRCARCGDEDDGKAVTEPLVQLAQDLEPAQVPRKLDLDDGENRVVIVEPLEEELRIFDGAHLAPEAHSDLNRRKAVGVVVVDDQYRAAVSHPQYFSRADHAPNSARD
jgi:hypothetical protein